MYNHTGKLVNVQSHRQAGKCIAADADLSASYDERCRILNTVSIVSFVFGTASKYKKCWINILRIR